MYLVTKSLNGINQLGYDPKKEEYVAFHNGKEVMREKGDTGLLDYFYDEVYAKHTFIDENKVKQFPVWNKYCEVVESL